MRHNSFSPPVCWLVAFRLEHWGVPRIVPVA
jgi:hypothetical protein